MLFPSWFIVVFLCYFGPCCENYSSLKKPFLRFLLTECSLFLSWSIRCNETFTNCISCVTNWTWSLFNPATEVRYELKPTSSNVIEYAITQLFTSFTNFNLRLQGPYLFCWMFIQLIYLHSATGELICVFFIISSPPISLHAVSRYFCFASMNALGFLILGKINVGFSFEYIIVFALVSRLGGIFVSLSWNGSRKSYVLFRSTSDIYMLKMRMSELWWTSLEDEAGNDVVRFETIQQHAVFCCDLQYKIVKKCVLIVLL